MLSSAALDVLMQALAETEMEAMVVAVCKTLDQLGQHGTTCNVHCVQICGLIVPPTLTAPADPSREVLIESRVPAQLIRRLTPGTVALQVALAPLARVGMY